MTTKNTKTYSVIKISRLLPYTNKQGQTNAGCVPVDSNLYSELEHIKNGNYKLIAEKVRAIADKDERSKFKQSNLPALAISGVFRKWRDMAHLVNHSRLICIDIDPHHNPHIQDWPALRNELSKLLQVLSVFLSVSGAGLALILKITPGLHKETFYYLSDYFFQIWGLRIDRGCNDVTRQRYVSDDPGCHINYNFDDIPTVEPTDEWRRQKASEAPHESITITGEVDSEINFLKAARDVETSKVPYSFEQGTKYFFLRSLAARCNIIGMSQERVEELVIKHYSEKANISSDDLLKPIKGIYKSYRSQHGTFEAINKRSAKEDKAKWILVKDFLNKGEQPTPEQIAAIASENDLNIPVIKWLKESIFDEMRNEFGYDNFHDFRKAKVLINRKWIIRKDIISEQIEMREHGTTWQPVNIDTIYCYLKEEKRQKIKKEDLKAIINSDFVEQYNPFFEYFEAAPYDSSADWIDKLSSFISCTDQKFWQVQFKKALVRSIACALGEDVNRIMLVLYGARQASGKTTFLRFLCPWQNKKYYTESPISGNVKDVAIRLSENFIYNVEELEGFHKPEINQFKAMISQATIKERRPHATFEKTRRRRCSFWGSTNDKSMLHDTENTRWLPFEVKEIDWSYKQNIDINKVWAQAYHEYKKGTDYTLSKEEVIKQADTNEEYRIPQAAEELLARHFELPCDGKEGRFFTSTELCHELNRVFKKVTLHPVPMGKAVKKVFGIDSTKNNGIRGYILVNNVPAPDD